MFECSFLALCHLTCWSVLLLVALFCIFYEVCWGCFSFVLNNLSPSLLYWTRIYEGVSKSYRTEAITTYTLTTINTRWEATQRVMAAKLTRLTHNIAIQLHLVAESCTICSSRSRRPVQKLLDTPSYTSNFIRSRGSSVSIETRLRAGWPGFDSQQWQWWDFFFLRLRVQTGSGAHPLSYPMETEGYFPRG
jgi:hypothetical protein